MAGIRYTEEEYADLIARRQAKGHNRVAVPVANAKRATPNEGARADPANEVPARVRIHYHSKRRRLIDPDRLYSHPTTDGIRKGGLLVDDSLTYVESVTNSQEKAKIEETVITVEIVK